MAPPKKPALSPLELPSELTHDEQLILATQAMHASGYLPNGNTKLSTRQAATLYSVKPSTLNNHFNGTAKSRREAHVDQQALTPAQEEVLVRFIKEMARRAIPCTRATVREYAEAISGQKLGEHWVDRFLARHTELRLKNTQGLEICRARALNATVVSDFYAKLDEIITTYDITPENIYNMDEKGIQLGQGAAVKAIVDRDLKTVYHAHDGSREMVTILETVCADGTALPPMVVFPAARHNLAWAENNKCHASIACSPNGWTDQELGTLWMEKHFEPKTTERNTSGGYRLLILDGHNSHCTYPFVRFAERQKIIVFCLPPHTTHALQPCDVGIFGPLASCWARVVHDAARENITITKATLLEHYSVARERALKTTTITAAFAKTGIWPVNADAIPSSAFKPSLHTSTEAAPAVPLDLPTILEPIPEAEGMSIPQQSPSAQTLSARSTTSTMSMNSTSSTSTTSSLASTSSQQYRIVGIPCRLKHTASQDAFREQNETLFGLLSRAQYELEQKHAQTVLLQSEIATLRRSLDAKKPKRKLFAVHVGGKARVLTDEEALHQLARAEFKKMLEGEEARDLFRVQKVMVDKAIQELEKRAKEARKQQEDVDKEREKQRKKKEAEALKRERQAQKEQERKEKREKAEEAKRLKALEKERERERKAAEKAAGAQGRKQGRGRARKEMSDTEDASMVKSLGEGESDFHEPKQFSEEMAHTEDLLAPQTAQNDTSNDMPRPRPRPKARLPSDRQNTTHGDTSNDSGGRGVPGNSLAEDPFVI